MNDLTTLIGKTIESIEDVKWKKFPKNAVPAKVFTCTDGSQGIFFHEGDMVEYPSDRIDEFEPLT